MRSRGLEPPRGVSPHGPEPCASANSATTAYFVSHQLISATRNNISCTFSLVNTKIKPKVRTRFISGSHLYYLARFIRGWISSRPHDYSLDGQLPYHAYPPLLSFSISLSLYFTIPSRPTKIGLSVPSS